MTRPYALSGRRAARRSVAIPGLAIVAVLLTPVTSPVTASIVAQAAGETCRGREATIVGGPVRLLGTAGPDVIVTNGSGFLNAGGGDDLICVSGEAGGGISIYAGSGNDIIDSTGAPDWTVYAALGSGADELVSGTADDQVYGGVGSDQGDMFGANDSETDTIATGDGQDMIVSGDFTSKNTDIIDAGPGDDQILWLGASLGAGGQAAGGIGSDTLSLLALTEQMTLDNNTGLASVNGVGYAAWTEMENFRIDELYGPNKLTFVGGPGAEHLFLPALVTQVNMGPGNDTVVVESDVVKTSTYDGGAGADLFHATTTQNHLWLDMASGRFDIGRQRGPDSEATVGEFEKFNAYASSFVWLRGTNGPDMLRPQACQVDIAGRGGDDRIRPWPSIHCGDGGQHATLVGGAGDDELLGTRGSDIIRGGAGRDVADGRGASDVCRTEVALRCER
jgi:Ca2+-binding RTX toxin-like protein